MTPTTPMAIDRRDGVGLVGALLLAAICVRLGFWQLDRLHQRRGHNAALVAAGAPPELPNPGGVPPGFPRARPLPARGGDDYTPERLWHGRGFEGEPGGGFLSPLRP